ncbi:MAG: carbohydrate kinase family protein [Vicinamibacterales bacterium]
MRRADLLTVGEAFEDFIFVGLPRLPKPGEEVRTSEFVQTIGGGAVITAVAAARLGVSCAIVSGLSVAAERRLKREGVWVRNVRRPAEAPALTASLSTRTNRSFVTFNGVNDVVEPRLFEHVQHATAKHVHFAFFPHQCRAWEPIVGALRQRGITSSWDFGWNESLLDDRRFPFLMTAVDYLFLNEQEAVLYSRRLNLEAAMEHWRTHPRHVVLKLGERGSRWIQGARETRAGAKRVKVVDPTGAGDAFNGGFLTAVLAGLPPTQVLRFANTVGALSTRRAGGVDALPMADELQ